MPAFTDQTGRQIILDKTPHRVISLVPSQTELLYTLGLDKEVVGTTKFCVHPDSWFRNKTKIGGTKKLRIDDIHKLKPDLIIANKEENVKEQVEELADHYPVWTSNVNNLDDAYAMIDQVGMLTGKSHAAKELIDQIKSGISILPTPDSRLPTCYLIWQNPYMTVGGDTFIHSMIEAAGFQNIFDTRKRYPEISIQDLLDSDCQLLLLASEPFPFKQKHIDELQPLLPKTKIFTVNGELFSWYGSRLLYAADYFQQLRRMVNAKR
ncbi:MAG: ABC transporter substrate-binding protein [Chitinophagales bacterium]